MVPQLPVGFTLKVVLLSSWGDLHYMGLNGLEIFDHLGEPIISKRNQRYELAAIPSSVDILTLFVNSFSLKPRAILIKGKRT